MKTISPSKIKAASRGGQRGETGRKPVEEDDAENYHCPDAPQRFWFFLKRHKDLIWVAVTGNFLTVFLIMLIPLIAKLVIDEAIPGKNVSLLVGLAVALFVMQAIRFVVAFGHDYLIHYIGQRTIFDIRRAVFHHLQLLQLRRRRPSRWLPCRYCC